MTWKLKQNKIDSEALRWVLLRDNGSLSIEQEDEFNNWLRASVRNEGAYIRAQAMLIHLGRISALVAGGQSVCVAPRPLATRRAVIAVGLSTLGAVGIGGWTVRDWIAETWRGVHYVSNIGQLRTVRLADGSVMTLNTATEAFVQYGRARREVRLARGEALFEVVYDAARPFLVRVGELTLRAVGTAFAVRRDSLLSQAKVTVTEGMVEMEMAKVNSEELQVRGRLAANQEAVINDSGFAEVHAISSTDADRHLAWRRGMLVFDGQSLREAIEEMNRYSHHEILIQDDELAARHVVGIFRATDTATFISAVEFTLGARAVARSNGYIVLVGSRSSSH